MKEKEIFDSKKSDPDPARERHFGCFPVAIIYPPNTNSKWYQLLSNTSVI